MVQHNNLVNFLAWEAAAFGHSPSDTFLQKTPTNFDVSVEEVWTPLVTGAPLVVAKPNGHKDTAYLLELIDTHGVTNLSMVPSQVGGCVGRGVHPHGWVGGAPGADCVIDCKADPEVLYCMTQSVAAGCTARHLSDCQWCDTSAFLLS